MFLYKNTMKESEKIIEVLKTLEIELERVEADLKRSLLILTELIEEKREEDQIHDHQET